VKIASSGLQSLLAQAGGHSTGAKEVQRVGNERAAMANAASPAQAAVSVHISAAGRAASAVSGTAGLAATARTQGTLQTMDAALRQNSNSAVPRAQIDTIRRIVEQVTGKQLGVFNSADLGPMAQINSIAQQLISATAAAAISGAGSSASSTYEASQLMTFSSSGMVAAQDGAQIGFTVLLELEMVRSQIRRQSIDVRVNHIGMASPQAKYAGSSADLLGHAFSFDVGVDDGEGGDRPLMLGAGVVAFDPQPVANTEDGTSPAQPGDAAAA
jgi:hypothetical protein